MIAIIPNDRSPLFLSCFVNHSGDPGNPSDLGHIPIEEFGRTLSVDIFSEEEGVI